MNIKKMTLQELSDLGAKIEVSFHEVEKGPAYEKVNQFKGINEIKGDNSNGVGWYYSVNGQDDEIEITAYYDSKMEGF